MTKNQPTMTNFKKLTDIDTLFQMLQSAKQTLDLSLTDKTLWQLLAYLDNLLLWNKAYNLTAITQPKDALIKHIIDCLAIVGHFERAFVDDNPKTILDIGTGAGLPSVVLSVVRPDWQITALDCNTKKIRFIRQMIAELDLPNLTTVASRIEDFDGKFSIITSRAFASLAGFAQLAYPYLADNGIMIAMKGKSPLDDELCGLDRFTCSVACLDVPYLSDDRCLVHLAPVTRT